MSGRAWTDEEKKILAISWEGGVSRADIALAVGHSEHACRLMASQLRVKRSYAYLSDLRARVGYEGNIGRRRKCA